MLHNHDEKWVFGYGSLMWQPGFAYTDQRHARVHGLHRALCIYSHVHRGTPENPGLVLGLDKGGSCRGIAYQVKEALWADTVEYLRLREQVTSVYRETQVNLVFDDGQRRRALVYVVDQNHHQYAGRLSQAVMAKFVSQGVGQSGPNPEYVLNTHAQLEKMGVQDRQLTMLARTLRTAQT